MKFIKKLYLFISVSIATNSAFAMNPAQDLALLQSSLTALAQAIPAAPQPQSGAAPERKADAEAEAARRKAEIDRQLQADADLAAALAASLQPQTSKSSTATTQPSQTRTPMQNKLLKEFKLNNGVTISIVEGDLVQQDVQAIVNAANSDLIHAGGIAKTISDEAGSELAKNQPKSCALGTACTTPSYNLKNKYAKTIKFIIHAVGPNCNKRDEEEFWEDKLINTYNAAIKEAIKLGVRSLAAPGISVGIFGCDPVRAALCAAKAIQESLKDITNSSLKEIRFVIWPSDPRSKLFGEGAIITIPEILLSMKVPQPAGEIKTEEEKKETRPAQETFAIATWNVLAQEYYTKWAKGATLPPAQRSKLFIAYLQGLMQTCDIIVLQEWLTNDQNIFRESLQNALKNMTFKVEVTNGLATLYNTSKFILKSFKRIITKKFDNGMLVTRFALKSDPKKELLVINTHLTGGVGNGYEQHRIDQLQDAELKKLIQEIKSKPIIMLGDFNTSTSGYDGVFKASAGFDGYPSMINATQRQATAFDTTGNLEAYDHIFYSTQYLKLIEGGGTLPPAQQLKSMLLTHGNGDQSKPDSRRKFSSDHAILLAEFAFL